VEEYLIQQAQWNRPIFATVGEWVYFYHRSRDFNHLYRISINDAHRVLLREDADFIRLYEWHDFLFAIQYEHSDPDSHYGSFYSSIVLLNEYGDMIKQIGSTWASPNNFTFTMYAFGGTDLVATVSKHEGFRRNYTFHSIYCTRTGALFFP